MPEAETRSRNQQVCNWLSIILLVMLALLFAISRLLHIPHPPVGTYIGVLAFVAAVVTIWPPDNEWAKAAWILVFGGFLVLEVSTLYQQRSEDTLTDRAKTREEDDRFTGLLKAQQDNFAQVLRDNQQHFDETLRHFERLGRLSTESIEELTGGDSWVWFLVVPNLPNGNPPTYELSMRVEGKHPLHDVTAGLRIDSPGGVIINAQGSVLKRGEATHAFDMVSLLNNTPTLLLGHSGPTGVRVGLGKYYVFIYARNGYMGETLELAYDDKQQAFERLSVERPGNIDRGIKQAILRQETVPLTLPQN